LLKKSNQKKSTPPSPKSASAGRAGGEELSLLLLMFKEGRPQTPSPLIRPADADFGGAERGEGQNQHRGDECGDVTCVEHTVFRRNRLRYIRLDNDVLD